MNKEKFMTFIRNPETLPEMAYALLPSDNREVIIVKKDEKGYYPHQTFASSEAALHIMNTGNEALGVCEEAKEALMLLSMRQS